MRVKAEGGIEGQKARAACRWFLSARSPSLCFIAKSHFFLSLLHSGAPLTHRALASSFRFLLSVDQKMVAKLQTEILLRRREGCWLPGQHLGASSCSAPQNDSVWGGWGCGNPPCVDILPGSGELWKALSGASCSI